MDLYLEIPGTWVYMGSCPNYGPFLGTLNIRGRIIIGTQKGTIILTTSHIGFRDNGKKMEAPRRSLIPVINPFLGLRG